MQDKDFQKLINQALESVPKVFLHKLENVSIVIADWPSKSQLASVSERGQKGILLGLYEGVPQTRRGRYGIGATLPDKITIFKVPILMISGSFSQVSENIRETVIHEIAHHFGMSEAAIRKTKLK